MKIAIVHDWLTGMRGGEKCLEEICKLYPNADLYTLIYIKGTVSPIISKMKIYTSFLQQIPYVKKKYPYLLPLMPTAINSFNLSIYDLVISSSHCVAKGVKIGKNTCHICYCHTPMRYIWSQYDQYFNKKKAFYVKFIFDLFLSYLRNWDIKSSHNVSHFIANSENISKRIKKYYNRNSQVIYPPVNIGFLPPTPKKKDYFLVASAFAPYKKLDLAINAFNKLKYPLKIIGKGQDKAYLKSISSDNIEFLGWVPDHLLNKYYSECRALIFPGEEDFGIIPVEVQAKGTPIIAFGKGGILETVIPINEKEDLNSNNFHGTGVFFNEQNSENLIDAVKKFEKVEHLFNRDEIRKNSEKFDKTIFINKFSSFVNSQVGSL